MAKKLTKPAETPSSFGPTPTYKDALELNAVLTDMKADSSVNNYYKLKLSCIDAMIKVRPLIEQVAELDKPSERFNEYLNERTKLFEEYAEKESGHPVLYKDMECTERIRQNDEHIRYIFYNFNGKDEEVDRRHTELKKKYSEAIASEDDRERTKQELLKSDVPDLQLKHVGTDYPSNISMRYMYSLLIFGIVAPKENA